MSRTVTLKALIYELALALDRTELTADLSGLAAVDGRRWVAALQRGYRDHYEVPFPWPESIEGDTLTLTGGKFQFSDIGYGDWWEAWTSDPRPVSSTATPITTRADGDGIWPVTTAGSVFVLWRPAAPKLAYVPVVSGTTYAAGAVVYDNSTGDCYEALVEALGSTLADTAKWRRQTLLLSLQEAALLQAEGYVREGDGQTDRADRLYVRARNAREREFNKVFENGRQGAWWRNEE